MRDEAPLRRAHPVAMVVEDEFIVALDLRLLLEDLGFAVMGPFDSMASASKALATARPDVALLDVQVKDGEVFPLADELAAHGVDLIFHSGHAASEELFGAYPGAAVCPKPTSTKSLRDCLQSLSYGPFSPAR